ncbi:carbon-nitrogen hydrolase family protein [Flavobacterium salilacus subsp. salilacus]|uniref:carbon-nitrogen hydrolase family protein n=1 Tax=Flavobacterium TaxID=237 RepID=UPI001075834C|nr:MULTISPECIES: carbon-nitrogen hydrolase family protein [Flavobacterium]KAF2518610.1 carbon-nitrogen hydrolase family protein [Flavobacterium salilacus subsp. salilacus]MBE1613567.1 carbon-nitrogen hydrolase family protein [Flavobacterium sp. SaA2.13]
MLDLPKFKAAAVQASPVFLNVDATVEKSCAIIAEAAGNGASLVAFPEVFVAGYPYWNWIMTPVQGSKWYEKLYLNSITVPGAETDRLCEAAKEHNCHVVIGVNERGQSFGEIYNTNLIINNKGEIVGKHRKLVPTWAEKLTWTGGDGSSLKVYDTEIGPIGTLACGENTNTLARYTLLTQGELIHVANYISLPVAPPDYNMAEAIKIRAAAHSFEGKLFTIVSCSTISKEIIDIMKEDVPNAEELLTRKDSAFTGFIGPNGAVIGEPLIDDEGIVYADIDLSKCIQPKQMHDILGHYNRFDIFDLRVNTAPKKNITFTDGDTSENEK